MRLRSLQRCGGRRARGRGAYGGDLTGVQDARRLAGCGLEQHHQALVRLAGLGEILRVDTDQLGAKGGILAQGARHDTEQVAACQRNDGAQKLARLTAREADHGLAYQRDAGLVGQASGDLFLFTHSHSLPPAGLQSKVWPICVEAGPDVSCGPGSLRTWPATPGTTKSPKLLFAHVLRED